jgi:hypothetical protein
MVLPGCLLFAGSCSAADQDNKRAAFGKHGRCPDPDEPPVAKIFCSSRLQSLIGASTGPLSGV